MKKINLSIVLAGMAVAALSLAASKPLPSTDIVDTAIASKQFPTLVAALKAAGLVDTLKESGPFTVFAPSEEAFRKLPKGTLESLLKPENKSKLVAILKYHVVSGKVMASDVLKLKNGTEVPTLQGHSIKVQNKRGVRVNNAKVVKTDIECKNGVIHVIDTVLLPK